MATSEVIVREVDAGRARAGGICPIREAPHEALGDSIGFDFSDALKDAKIVRVSVVVVGPNAGDSGVCVTP